MAKIDEIRAELHKMKDRWLRSDELLNEKDKEYNDAKKRAALIATHEAMKVVWPKYALDKGEGPNIYKRLKIPFTPITTNKQMRSVRILKFNPSMDIEDWMPTWKKDMGL